MLSIKCAAQKYEWGRPAAHSEVAQLSKANGNEIDEGKPYAELWMGTHPNCPAVVTSTGQTLSSWIQDHPYSVGEAVVQQFGPDLPFLFKVLSVNKALSIQSHPDKQLAERLHTEHPKLYPDNNHKPEMALAISDDFEALCAFAPLPDIVAAVQGNPELRQLIGEQAASALANAEPEQHKQALRAAFTALMTASPEAVAAAVSGLITRLQAAVQSGQQLAPHDELALRLDKQYPGGDVGVLAAYFLNYVKLRSGQALFLGANEPHAYLAGELVECMAASDNVIRAGLTPKFKHADVLCASLTYETGQPEVYEGSVQGSSTAVKLYRPPTQEFEIRNVQLSGNSDGEAAICIGPDPGPMIILVQQGAGSVVATEPSGSKLQAAGCVSEAQLNRGGVWFVAAGTRLDIKAAGHLNLWVAAVNSTFFALHSALAGATSPVTAVPAAAPQPALVGA